MAGIHNYDYICVIDFEATCVEDIDKAFYPHEIIEFPAIIIDIDKHEIVSTFHSFVRPLINPQLSDFCKNLTGITQVSVDNAETFPYVLSRFVDWTSNAIPEGKSFIILTDGSWDMSKFLALQCIISQVDFPLWANDWIDIKHTFRHYNHDAYRARLMDMLETYDLEFDGRLHSGKDDTYNIAQLALAMLRHNCYLIVNSSISADSTQYLKRKLSTYLRERRKQQSQHTKPARKETTQPRSSSHVCDESAMDIDPDLIGCEHVLLKHKKK